MRTRGRIAVLVTLIGSSVGRAQPAVPALPAPLPPVPAAPMELPLAEVPATIEEPGQPHLPPVRVYCAPACEECGPPGRWWVAPALELAWVPRSRAPANLRLRLPTLGGSIPGPVVPVAGESSGRFDAALGLVAGFWFSDANTRGLEASLFLRDAHNTFGALAPGFLVNFPRGPDRSTAQIIPFPEPFSALIVGSFPSTLGTFFFTTDVNYRRKLLCGQYARIDALAGYRYAVFRDELYLGEPSRSSDDPDDFDHTGDSDEYRRNRLAVTNTFNGGQIGLAGEVRGEKWYVAGSAKVAFGGVTSNVSATGVFLGAEGQVGGRFERLSALASGSRSAFAVVPVVNVQLGRQIGPHARLFVSYSFLSLNRVTRVGGALDPTASRANRADFWVQSIGLGGEFRF